MFATRDLIRACARSGLCLSTAVAFRPCEKSCVYIAPRTPAPEHSLTRGSRRAFNLDLGHPDLSQPGARDDQGHQHFPLIYTVEERRAGRRVCVSRLFLEPQNGMLGAAAGGTESKSWSNFITYTRHVIVTSRAARRGAAHLDLR